MALAFHLTGLMELVAEAGGNPTMLPVALVTLGVVQSVAALSLILSKGPTAGGILFHLHGNAPGYLYYGILVFGLAEASFGYWVVPRDLDGWRAVAKTVAWVSMLPFILVVALGARISAPEMVIE
uniref:Uncharacterized protein n=1 Tax=Leersia perrieri TaxID=77586 RepID=A0A0D9WLS4_9ORYZ